MSHQGDNIVLYLLIALIIFLLLKRWLSIKPLVDLKKYTLNNESYIAKGDVPDLLREYGFEVLSSKEKVELAISVDEDCRDSRLYIDYVASKEDAMYIVIIAKERKPIRMSGAALRDAFLAHYLLFQPEGIVYVEREKKKLKVVSFDVPELKEEKRDWVYPISYLFLGMGLGVIFTWMMLK